MDDEQSVVSSRRIERLAEKLRDRKYRHSYVASHTRQFLAKQMRAFRGTKSQTEFARSLGTTQSIVSSRLEDPNYGKWTLQTLLDVGEKLDVAVFVRFVDFPTFVTLSDDMSPKASRPDQYADSAMDAVAMKVHRNQGPSGLEELFKSIATPSQESERGQGLAAGAIRASGITPATHTDLQRRA